MKSIFGMIGLLFTGTLLFGNDNIPKAVLKAFQKDYPSVVSADWEQRAEGYAAMFNGEEGLTKVFYTREGEWTETRTRLPLRELPAGVQKFIKKHYADAEVTYAGKVETPTTRGYRIESELPDAVIVKILNGAGKLLQEERISFSIGLSLPLHEPIIMKHMEKSDA